MTRRIILSIALLLNGWIAGCHSRSTLQVEDATPGSLDQVLDQIMQLRGDIWDLNERLALYFNSSHANPRPETAGELEGDDLIREIQAVLNRHRDGSLRRPLDPLWCNSSSAKIRSQDDEQPHQQSVKQEGRSGKFRTAAISSDAETCSTIGRRALLDGGNAVDAAIATLFCLGLFHPQSGGIGGGFLMTIADTKHKGVICLDARETAPSAATENMFNGNASLSQRGALSVAVPGELAGYWAAHQAFGQLPWPRLVLPTAVLAEKGVPVNKALAEILQRLAGGVLKDEPTIRRIFFNQATGDVLKTGDTLKMPQLAKTLRIIAHEGIDVFYNGSIGDQLVEDVQRRGGILSKEDLLQYRALWVNPVRVDLKGNLTLFSSPPPGSGVLVAYIMKILDEMGLNELGSKDPLTYHRIAEAFKHAYAQRTKLGDPQFVPEVNELLKRLITDELAEEIRGKINDSFTSNDPEFYGAVTYTPDDHGTAHVSVLDGDGMAVSATSTINLWLGAGFISEQTGIILNDEMDDFSSPNVTSFYGVPPSPANFIRPGKRPMSSMAPTVVIDRSTDKVRSVLGAIGGTKITSSVVYALIQNLWFGESIKEAIDSRRIHHQLLPMTLQYEKDFPMGIVEDLMRKGHQVKENQLGASSVFGLSVDADGFIHAGADQRKGGGFDGIDPVD